MKVVAFVYDFPHVKSVTGLLHLPLLSPASVVVVGAPEVAIPGRPRDTTAGPHAHPRDISQALGFSYRATSHSDSAGLIRSFGPDIGFVFGARILPRDVIATGVPIVNFHPGLAPDNRGLDAIPWAVAKGLPQAVTIHLIGSRIDAGPIVATSLLRRVHPTWSFERLRHELTSLEADLLASLMLHLRAFGMPALGAAPASAVGEYHSALPESDMSSASDCLEGYLSSYGHILETWISATRDDTWRRIDALSARAP